MSFGMSTVKTHWGRGACYHNEEVSECEKDILKFEESRSAGTAADQSLTECKLGEVVRLESFWKKSEFTLFVPLKFYF